MHSLAVPLTIFLLQNQDKNESKDTFKQQQQCKIRWSEFKETDKVYQTVTFPLYKLLMMHSICKHQ
jgi:hypothetical protein